MKPRDSLITNVGIFLVSMFGHARSNTFVVALVQFNFARWCPCGGDWRQQRCRRQQKKCCPGQDNCPFSRETHLLILVVDGFWTTGLLYKQEVVVSSYIELARFHLDTAIER